MTNITEAALRELRQNRLFWDSKNPHENVNPLPTDEPNIEVWYDPMPWASFVLVRKTFDDEKNKRGVHCNHIIFDENRILDEPSEVPKIFQNAIEKIKEGKCFIWKSNDTFTQKTDCDKPHS